MDLLEKMYCVRCGQPAYHHPDIAASDEAGSCGLSSADVVGQSVTINELEAAADGAAIVAERDGVFKAIMKRLNIEMRHDIGHSQARGHWLYIQTLTWTLICGKKARAGVGWWSFQDGRQSLSLRRFVNPGRTEKSWQIFSRAASHPGIRAAVRVHEAIGNP